MSKYFVNRNGNRYGLKFTDESIYPFLGEHKGKRLKYIEDSFWEEFILIHDKDRTTWFDYHTVCGRLVSYAKRRLKPPKKGRHSSKGWFMITNGKVNKMLRPNDTIPEGWYKGSVGIVNNMLSDKFKKARKDYWSSEEGRKKLKARWAAMSFTTSKNKGKKGKKWISDGINNMLLHVGQDLPDGWHYGRTITDEQRLKISNTLKEYYAKAH